MVFHARIRELDSDRLYALGKFLLERVEDHFAPAGLGLG